MSHKKGVYEMNQVHVEVEKVILSVCDLIIEMKERQTPSDMEQLPNMIESLANLVSKHHQSFH